MTKNQRLDPLFTAWYNDVVAGKDPLKALPALLRAIGDAKLGTVASVVEALDGTPDKPAGDGPMSPSYPPAYDAATALDNIRHGYGYTGLRDGRRLSDEQLKEREAGVDAAVAALGKLGIPADMAEYGYRYGLTGFGDTRTFSSPGSDLAEFVGKSLQTWLDQEWAIRAGGGTPSIGGGSRV